MTPWDRRLFLRALAGAVFAFVVVVIITAATDTGATMARRIMTSLPVAPFASGFGAYVALAGARRERELAALDVSGVAPRRARLFAWIGATLPGTLLAFSVLSARVDASVVYPQVRPESRWIIVADARGSSFSSDDLGVTITPDGSILLREAIASHGSGADDLAHRVSAALVLSAMSATWALALAGTKRGRSRRLLAQGIASLAVTLLFQLAATNHIAPALFVVVALMFAAGGTMLPQMIERALRRAGDPGGGEEARS